MKNSITPFALLIFATTITGCGNWELKEVESTKPAITNEPSLKVCPSVEYMRPIPQRPNISSFNLAQNRVTTHEADFVSDGDYLYSYPSAKRINMHEANSLLLVSGQRLIAIGKNSVTVYDITAPDSPKKMSQLEIERQISAARIVGQNLVIVSQSVIDSLQHPAEYVNECKTYPGYTEEIYQTKITRMRLDDLTDDESVDLIGNVTSHVSEKSIEFREPLEKGKGWRVLSILPDGQLGQPRFMKLEDLRTVGNL
ncbi:hypothetical protein EBR21_11490 [bacterium]|nr:hypothetical protein [bacterium]